MRTRHRRDAPLHPTISVRELAVAWVLVGAIALGVIVAQPAPPRADGWALMAQAATPAPPRDPTQDGFEDAADRAATLAGTEDAPAASPHAPARPPASIALDRRETDWHLLLCHWIAKPALAARHPS